jgi:hypothetical protein
MLLLLREKRLRASPLVARSTTARILWAFARGRAIIKRFARCARSKRESGFTFAKKHEKSEEKLRSLVERRGALAEMCTVA